MGVPARCMCGRPRQPALRERVSITPSKSDRVNLRFATDQAPSLAASRAECYAVRADPSQSLHVRLVMGGKISRTAHQMGPPSLSVDSGCRHRAALVTPCGCPDNGMSRECLPPSQFGSRRRERSFPREAVDARNVP